MDKSSKLIWVAAGVVLAAVVGAIVGLSLGGVFDSGDSASFGSNVAAKAGSAQVDSSESGADAVVEPDVDVAEEVGKAEEAPASDVSTELDADRPHEPTQNAPDELAKTEPPGPTPDVGEPAVDAGIEPDPNYKQALSRARLNTSGWKTDFSLHTIDYGEVLSGGVPRDGISPLDNPKFTTSDEANEWLADQEPVIALEVDGHAVAYPLQVLTWHEIANDVVGDVPVAVTFCPLCNAAIVFDRRLDGVVHDFGVSGKLRNSDLIMWDRQTESWWQQFTGEGIVGELAGKRLTLLPSSIISWADFRAAHPEARVLSRDTGFSRPYGTNPYAGYDEVDNPPFLYRGPLDGRLLPKERVVSVTVGDVDAAFPFSVLEEEGAVNYPVDGRPLVVFFKSGTTSALDGRSIKDSRDVGATGVFDSTLDGRALTFRVEGDAFIDKETGSEWNILGQAVDGPLSGKQLTPIVHANHFWFAWGAFKPDTVICQGMG